jgi:hypothetical protein
MHTSRSMDDILWSQGLTGRFPSKDQPQNQSNIRRNSAAHVERILQVLGVLGKSSMLGKRMLNAILRMRSTDRQGHPAWKRSHDLAAFETEELFPSLFYTRASTLQFMEDLTATSPPLPLQHVLGIVPSAQTPCSFPSSSD